MGKQTAILLNVVFIASLYAVTGIILFLAVSETYVASDAYVSLRLFILLLFLPIIFKYIIQIFFAPWYPLVEAMRRRKASRSYTPSVSVLIPAHNEEVGIASTIASVCQMRYPHLEIGVPSGTSMGWLTNQVEGDYVDINGTQHYMDFVKIVWIGLVVHSGGSIRSSRKHGMILPEDSLACTANTVHLVSA